MKDFKRMILVAAVLLLLCGTAHAAFTTSAANFNWNSTRMFNRNGQLDLWTNEIEDYLDGSTAVGYFYLDPTDTEPGTSDGMFYFDDSENTIKVYSGAAWVALGAGTFTGGSISSDITLGNGVDIYSSTTTAHTSSIGVYDVDGTAYVDVLDWTNANTPAILLGNTSSTLGIASTAFTVSTAGAVSGVTSLGMGGALTGVTTFSMSGAMTADSYTFANGGVFSNDTDTELSFAENTEDVVWDFTTDGLTWKSSTGVVGMAFGDVDALTGINTIALDAAAGGLSLAADGTDDDLTVAVTGAQNASLILASSGTAVDAMQITTSAGGIDITNGGAASGEDLDLTSTSASINLTAGEAAVDAVVIASSGGFDVDTVDDIALTVVSGGAGEDILLTQTGANASSITLAAAGTATDTIGLQASAGGVDIDAAATFDVGIAGGQVAIVSKDDAASAISLTANVGTSETIVVANTLGTDEAAINIDATAGGIDIDAATGKNIAVTGGQFIVTSNEAVASAINLVTNTGAAETIVVTNTQGTGAGAITLAATAGGVDVDAAAALDLNLAGGQVALVSKDDAASAISLTTNVGTSETIAITNTAGTGEDALNIDATAGGIDIDFATAKNMAITGGQFIVTSNESVASAINLVTNTGVLETIVATNTQGTDEGAITLTSTAGGIDLNAAALKNITLDGGQILLESADDVASSIALTTNNGTSETIVVTNTQGTAVGAITLTSTAGGITLNGASGGVVFTAGQTRKQTFDIAAVTLDGTAPPALVELTTDGQTQMAALQFDADGGVTGDDFAYITWRVPDGYVTDSARLNISYSFDTAEAADSNEAQFDFTVNAIASGEAIDAAGTALADQTTVFATTTTDAGKIFSTGYNIEVEDIVIDDLVHIQIAVDESASTLQNAGTLDVCYIEIEWESTE